MTMITESESARAPLAATGFLATMAHAFTAYRRSRHTLGTLGGLDDHILRDIGLTRADVMQASAADSPADGMTLLSRARSRRSA